MSLYLRCYRLLKKKTISDRDIVVNCPPRSELSGMFLSVCHNASAKDSMGFSKAGCVGLATYHSKLKFPQTSIGEELGQCISGNPTLCDSRKEKGFTLSSLP